MNHNTSAVIGVSPWYKNDSIHQKTFGLNDFYFLMVKAVLRLEISSFSAAYQGRF